MGDGVVCDDPAPNARLDLDVLICGSSVLALVGARRGCFQKACGLETPPRRIPEAAWLVLEHWGLYLCSLLLVTGNIQGDGWAGSSFGSDLSGLSDELVFHHRASQLLLGGL